VLFTIQPALGHFHPVVPLARALVAAGHEVAFATSRSFCPVVEAAGLRGIPAGLDWLESEPARAFPEFSAASIEEQTTLVIGIFGGAALRRMVPDLLEIAKAFRPDVIVREYWEFGGYIAAELLHLPHVTAGIGLFLPMTFLLELFATGIDAVRVEHGLAPDPEGASLFRDLYLHFLPPSYQTKRWAIPIAEPVRPGLFDRTGDDALPAWVDALPERPTIYATLGTVANQTLGVFQAILAAIRDEPVNLVMTVGRNGDPGIFGPQPDNVHIEPFIPQSLLLPRCDLVICHGGYNTVMASLSVGLPMLILPLFADQPFHGRRCAEMGVALTLSPADASPEAIRAAVRELLEDPAYRARAEEVGREIEALPGEERAVELLADLVRRWGAEPLGLEAPGSGDREPLQ
jgi:UDP:flavonoid glycosyltransferase YjiC (YdhE family)